MVIFCGFLMICVSWGRLVFVLLINGFFWDVFNKEVLDVFRNFKKKKLILFVIWSVYNFNENKLIVIFFCVF